MDSKIPFGQKNTLAEYMILAGADNRLPMLDKDLYDSWKSRMELYMQNREHRRMILESVEHDPLIWPTIEENGGLPADIYSLVNHHRVANDLWERVQLLMHGTSLTKQERESKPLLPEWSKFVTDVKLVKDLHTTNYDQLHAYLEQHELYANEVHIMRERNQDPLELSPHYGSIPPTQHYSTTYPSTPLAISYHSTPVTVQPLQGRPNSYAAGTSGTRANTLGTGGNYSGQQRDVKCYNCQGEGHISRQCPKPKRKRDATWFRDKVLLVEAHGNGKVMNEEELEFLADPGIAERPVVQSVITQHGAYQADDLDAYDSECDKITTAKAVLMASLSSYGSDVLFEVPHSDNIHNEMLNQSVQEMSYSKQTHLVNYPKNEITSDSNIIPYSQYLLKTQNAAVQDTNSSTQQDAMILYVFEQLSHHVTNCNKVNKDKLMANETLSAELERYKERDKDAQFADFEKEINSLKQTLSEQLKEKESLTKRFNVLKNESKEKEAKNIDNEIDLEKKVKELDNTLGFQNPFHLKKAHQIRPMLYDGSVIAKETNVISIANFKETLMLEEEIRSKMLLKQNDPMVLEKKVNIKPINYAELNQISEDFGKYFVPQRELSDEQAFRLQTSHPNTNQSAYSFVKFEAP
ncbi:retrovirus-related pol polyprotein from transposon TNT 1-94 [Tanacetum coccineum]|uniref:Retrovirus-related pol polyprotein from transposon TNT 1-94 n=1 Tax=Tanacetum coccineum TaxID=301880 RepID=A0ABQ5FMY1_9ASTR